MTLFIRTRLISVSDPAKKTGIQQLLSQNGIVYKIKVKDFYNRNFMDTAKISYVTPAGNKGKMTYSFYVNKKDEERAIQLIKGLQRYS